jgi:hypothetical protein
MSEQPKPLRVEFAPGAFDDFEGTQQELDELMKEITDMFVDLTPEELEAQSSPVDIDELIARGDEAVVEALMRSAGRGDRLQ